MPTMTDQITKTPGICGGNACIRGTRITVWGLVEWRRLGLSDAAIMERVQDLTQSELDAAWQYAAAYPREIEETIRINAEAWEPMALLYADEDFDYPIVECLRQLGYDVLTVQEAGQRGGDDPHVLSCATADNRAVLTHNRWDFEHLHRQSISHCGIVSCSRDPDAAAAAGRIDLAIKSAGSLIGQHIRVNLQPGPWSFDAEPTPTMTKQSRFEPASQSALAVGSWLNEQGRAIQCSMSRFS
jgi:uncharacterized protein (DUF433 family)